jgi:hypothetical protein
MDRTRRSTGGKIINMSTQNVQFETAYDILFNEAKRVYRGKKFQDTKTEEVYQFISFMSYCIDGQVRTRNLTKGIEELLPFNRWFALRSYSVSSGHAQSSPKCPYGIKFPKEVQNILQRLSAERGCSREDILKKLLEEAGQVDRCHAPGEEALARYLNTLPKKSREKLARI